MTKNTVPVIGVIFSSIFLAACTAQVAPPAPTYVTPTTSANASDQSQTMTASLRDLIAKGGSVMCTFSASDTQSKSQTNGTIYASGNRFAEVADTTITGVNTPQKMNVISDGTYVYSWSEGSNVPGIKMKFEVSPTPTAAQGNAQASSTGLDKKMDMKCGNWTIDETKFTVPTTVTFTDVSAMMTGKTPAVPKVPTNIPVKIPGY